MKSHPWSLALLAGLLCLPAITLRAEQISAASLTNQTAATAIVESSVASHGESAALNFAELIELSAHSTADAVAETQPASFDAASPAATSPEMVQANFSPIGIMVATSTVTAVPEPSTVVLLGCGALGIFLAARRRK